MKRLLVLVTYDVAVSKPSGAKRLRRVAKVCEQYGIRVQNSVFECKVDATQYKQLQYALLAEINEQEDSIRFYEMGNKYKNKVLHFGAKEALDVEDVLIL